MNKLIYPTLAIVALTTAAAFAQDIDTNGDGMVSYEELLASFPSLSEASFTTADADGDGMLNGEELAAAQEAGLIPARG
ncbi:MAG: hypothetical protein AAGF74_16415 [Pseudomonadota bacterium]